MAGHGSDQDERAHNEDRACTKCGAFPRWESRHDEWGERWLSICECGSIDGFFPDRRNPTERPPEPLAMYLQGHRRTARENTQPWIRLFLNSLEDPFAVRWRHAAGTCSGCEAVTVFVMLAWPTPDTPTFGGICLNCGYVTIERAPRTSRARRTLILAGRTWSPACPAVIRLRQCIYRAPHIITRSENEN